MIDLILATRGRFDEPLRFLRSLLDQTHEDFRVLVVDQNDDDRLETALGEFAGTLALRHLRSRPGADRARNVGLGHSTADIVAFPDDDCWYPPSLLKEVGEALAAHPEWDGLSGRSIDENGRPSVTRWHAREGVITPRTVWRRANFVTIFLRRELVQRTGLFDESLGPGAGTPWGASEEMDYLLRALRAGCRVYYEPGIVVHHPRTREQLGDPDPAIGARYAMGMGRVLAQNGAPAWFAWYHVARAYGGALLSLILGRPAKARFYRAVARGRLRGWRSLRTSS